MQQKIAVEKIEQFSCMSVWKKTFIFSEGKLKIYFSSASLSSNYKKRQFLLHCTSQKSEVSDWSRSLNAGFSLVDWVLFIVRCDRWQGKDDQMIMRMRILHGSHGLSAQTGAKDKVKRTEGPPARGRGQEGPLRLLVSNIAEESWVPCGAQSELWRLNTPIILHNRRKDITSKLLISPTTESTTGINQRISKIFSTPKKFQHSHHFAQQGKRILAKYIIPYIMDSNVDFYWKYCMSLTIW